jgi:hypothetical protein
MGPMRLNTTYGQCTENVLGAIAVPRRIGHPMALLNEIKGYFSTRLCPLLASNDISLIDLYCP